MHQIGMRTTSSIKRNRQQFNSTYIPPLAWRSKKKVKPIFFFEYIRKSCIFEYREYIEIKKNWESQGKSV